MMGVDRTARSWRAKAMKRRTERGVAARIMAAGGCSRRRSAVKTVSRASELAMRFRTTRTRNERTGIRRSRSSRLERVRKRAEQPRPVMSLPLQRIRRLELMVFSSRWCMALSWARFGGGRWSGVQERGRERHAQRRAEMIDRRSRERSRRIARMPDRQCCK